MADKTTTIDVLKKNDGRVFVEKTSLASFFYSEAVDAWKMANLMILKPKQSIKHWLYS